jgi:predicted nucleic acid-binding protein
MKYVDADVLVYWALDHPEHGETATRLLRHIEVNEKACTSALSLYLFDAVLAELEVPDYDLGRFLDELQRIRNLRIEPLTERHHEKAAPVRRELDVPLDVAIGLVVAQEKKADAVYSNQAAWEKTPLPRRFREA